MSSFTAQLVHDVSNWTSSIINSVRSQNTNPNINDDEKKNEEENDKKTDSQIVSNLMVGAMGENMLIRLMHPDFRYAAKLWNQLLCHKINASYPAKHLLKPIDIKHNKSNIALMNEIRYSMRHSFCSYQPAIVAMKSEEVSLAFKTQKSLLKTCFNISADDIIIDHCSLKMDNFLSKTHEPSFYLIVDHNTKKIVLSIRGTSSIGDVITDLDAKSKLFNGNLLGMHGYVHEGMLESAYFIRKSVSLPLVNLCEIYTNYGVIITGHSLGAGIASILGLMYKEHPIIYKKNGLKVYSFASPPIASKEFVELDIGNEYITSIALSTDVVTRLSWESVRKFNLRQDFIMQHPKEMIFECIECANDDDESVAAEFLRVLRSLESPKPNEQLYPLGKILWFVPKNMIMDEEKSDKYKDFKDENVEIAESKLNGILSKTWNNISSIVSLDSYDGRIDSSANDIFREFYHDLSKGFNDIKTDIECKLDKSVGNKKYRGDNYVLCNASSSKYIFQELLFDFPESFNAHEPQRYLWALDATLRE